MEYSPPPFFKRGPSLLTRFAFFSLLSVVLLVSDARFSYLYVLRQVVAVVVYPVQRLSAMPGELIARVGEFFVTAGQLQRDNEQLKRQSLLDTAALQTQQALTNENQHLRQLLAMRERVSREFIAADILYGARDPFTKKGDYWPETADVKRFVAAARKAAADGYPGTALKLGHDLWSYRDHHAASHEMLGLAYSALGRDALKPQLARAIAYRKRYGGSR